MAGRLPAEPTKDGMALAGLLLKKDFRYILDTSSKLHDDAPVKTSSAVKLF